jgi:hypothetical protein
MAVRALPPPNRTRITRIASATHSLLKRAAYFYSVGRRLSFPEFLIRTVSGGHLTINRNLSKRFPRLHRVGYRTAMRQHAGRSIGENRMLTQAVR